ncbi:MAG: hypothetical protein ACLPKB_32395 [Xanthobacteraceae bacterium]
MGAAMDGAAKSASEAKVASQSPPDQVTLIYRNVDGVHSFSLLEIPGLIVSDHDLKRAFEHSIKGAGRLIGDVCNQAVEYSAEISFSQFKDLIDRQEGTANKGHVVAVKGNIQRSEVTAACH